MTTTMLEIRGYVGENMNVLASGEMCWTGGLVHTNGTAISLKIAGVETSIKFHCKVRSVGVFLAPS
jgi:hypothetical protein